MLSADASPYPGRFSGFVVAIYLLVLLYLARALVAALPRACGLSRLERRWIDLWLR